MPEAVASGIFNKERDSGIRTLKSMLVDKEHSEQSLLRKGVNET